MTAALPPYRKGSLPRFPGWAAALGPGIVWMALAQGSGELIWWPYIVAKYGLTFLCLLIPACLLQFPINYAIGSYTLLTGETIFQGFVRLNRWVALIGFLGTVSYAVLLWTLNYRWLPKHVDSRLCPQRWALIGLVVAGLAYAALAIAYLWVRLRQ